MLGEDVFFTGCELLRFSKDNLADEDKSRLNDYTDFNIFMSIIHDKSGSMIYNISCAKQVLNLIFPMYDIYYGQDTIVFFDLKDNIPMGSLNNTNFLEFKEIISQMFCLKKAAQEQEYNTQGELAKKIADKFK